MDIRIEDSDFGKFKKYQNQIMDIYMEACSNGVMEQFLDRAKEEKMFYHLFDSGGYGYIVFDGKKLIGFVFAIPLAHDPLLPDSIRKRFPVEKSLKIAEIHMHYNYRRKESGSRLIQKLIDEVDRSKWDHLFILTWKDNLDAIKLYKRFGFKLDEVIDQEKLKKKTKERFVVQEQYLYRKL